MASDSEASSSSPRSSIKITDVASLGTVFVAAFALGVQAWSTKTQSDQAARKEAAVRADERHDRKEAHVLKRFEELRKYFNELLFATQDVIEAWGTWEYDSRILAAEKKPGKAELDRLHRAAYNKKAQLYYRIALGRVELLNPKTQESIDRFTKAVDDVFDLRLTPDRPTPLNIFKLGRELKAQCAVELRKPTTPALHEAEEPEP